MSTAEISAYLYGQHLARLALAEVEAGCQMPDSVSEVFPPEQGVIMCRLGSDKYAYWVLRGSKDALTETS
jgi:hypothetical protein